MTAQTQLGVPPVDDTMELATSPFQHVDDLDLDFDHVDQHAPDEALMDDTADGSEFIDDAMEGDENDEYLEDENMVEDQGEGTEHLANDFDMSEEHHNDQYEVEPQDEDILYDEDDVVQPDEEHVNQGDVDFLGEEEEIHPEPINDADTVTTQTEIPGQPDAAAGQYDHGSTEPTAEETVPGKSTYDAAADEANPELYAEDTAPDAQEQQDIYADEQYGSTEQEQDAAEHHDESVTQKISESVAKPENNAETTVAAQPDDGDVEHDGEHEALVEDSAVQEALHAIRLDWGDKVFPLFPTFDGDASQSFVSDTSFAYEPLNKLLTECHHVIHSELERAFQDELVLDVDVLGLHICEDSKYAEQISLAHIVEVYLLLKRNETNEDVAPLPCRISSRTCLKSQYDYLLDAAKQHRTFSSIISEADPNSPLAEPGYEPCEHEDTAEHSGVQVETSLEDDSKAPQPEIASLDTQTDSKEVVSTDQTETYEAAVEGQEAEYDTSAATGAGQDEKHEVKSDGPEQSLEQQDVFADEDLFEGLNDQAEQGAALDAEPSVTVEVEGSASSHTVEDDSKLSAETFEQAVEANDQLEVVDGDSLVDDDVAAIAVVDDEKAEDIFDDGDNEFADSYSPELNSADAQQGTDQSVGDDTQARPTASNGIAGGVDAKQDDTAVENTLPPVTPQKSIPSKRKAPEEEEEEDLLDFGFDTPEPKRSRAA